jgi:phage FluMu gp28-like protein
MQDEKGTVDELFVALTGTKPFPYQVKFLNETGKRIAFRSGRQVGKTTCAAVKAIAHALSMENRLVLNLAPTLRQSSLLFRKIRTFIKGDPVFERLVESDSQTRISFKNGSEIHCLPGNSPDSVRGFSPTLLIIDEAAFVKDDVFVAVLPSLAATNGDLIYISTPYGKRGVFYEAFNSEQFSKFHHPSIDSPLITEDFLEGMRDIKTDLEFLQEYKGEFIEEADAYFGRDLITSVIGDTRDLDGREHSNRAYYLGVDVARYGLDETCYIVVEYDGENADVVKMIATSKKPLTDVIGRVQELHKKFQFDAVYMDASGIGGGAVDVLQEKGVPLKSLDGVGEGVTFTIQNKEEIYKNLKLLMERKFIRIPKHDKLLNQLAEMQYEFTEAGHLKIHHPDNGHDDYPDALALSVAGIIKGGSYTPYIAMG